MFVWAYQRGPWDNVVLRWSGGCDWYQIVRPIGSLDQVGGGAENALAGEVTVVAALGLRDENLRREILQMHF